MKLSSETIAVLKNFSTINQSIIFKAGNTIKTISPLKTVMASANVPDVFPREAGIYNLGQLLATLSMYKDPELTFNENYLAISEGDVSEGNVSSGIGYSDPSMIISPQDKEINMPQVDVTVEVPAKVLSNVLKATTILGLPEIAFVGEDGICYMKAIDSSNPTSNSHSVEVGKTDDTFTLIIKAVNINILPSDYTIELSSKGISRFAGKYASYFIAIESKSTYTKG